MKRIACFVVCVLMSTVAFGQNTHRLLLAPGQQLSAERRSAKAMLERPTLRALRDGKVKRLVLADVALERKSSKVRKNTSTWVGKSRDGRSQLILTSGRDHVYGRMLSNGVETLLVPGAEPFTTKMIRPDPALELKIEDCEDAPRGPPTNPGPPPDESDDDGTVIDVMILYTQGWADAHPGEQAGTRLQYLIDIANTSYTNSLINTQIRLVHSAAVAFSDHTTASEALNAIRNNDGVFSNVEAMRTTYGADQVTLVRQLVTTGCGLASMMIPSIPRRAYAMISDDYKTDGLGAKCSDFVYAHEIGHNLGCSHDRNWSSYSRFPYSYGYQATPSRAFHTVMAYWNGCGDNSGDYPCPRVAHFSNPNVSYGGEATGIADPSPDSADNARAINITRVEMAAYRDTVYGVTPTPTPTPGGPTPTPVPTGTPTPPPTATSTPVPPTATPTPIPPVATPTPTSTPTATPTPTPAPALTPVVTIPVMSYRSSDGGIYQIDCVYDGASVKIFVNGIEVFSITTDSL